MGKYVKLLKGSVEVEDFIKICFFLPRKYTSKRKEGESMCMTLKKIDGLSARELLNRYGVNSEPPIDLKMLAKNIGIFSKAFDFSEAEQRAGYGKGDIKGAVLSEGDALIILYANTLSDKEARMVIAHEIGHCCQHAGDLKRGHLELATTAECEINHVKEDEAKAFAEALLVPIDRLKYICDLLVKPTVSILSDIFQVPPENIVNISKTLLSCRIIDDVSPQNEGG